jgi:hypothetical protein
MFLLCPTVSVVHSFAVCSPVTKSHCETYQGKEVCIAVITSLCVLPESFTTPKLVCNMSWYVYAESLNVTFDCFTSNSNPVITAVTG